jgi:tmRNA-binding protein
MAEFLFITPQELKSTTILGGNVDQDKFLFSIANVQIVTIQRLLGTELYDVILEGAENDSLTGNYLTIYDKFVKPITKNQALAEYIKISSYMIANGGAFKHSPENSELMTTEEINTLADTYSGMADTYIGRFEKWLCHNTIPEYKLHQDEVNASKTITNRSGWFFGKPSNRVQARIFNEGDDDWSEYSYKNR